MIVEQVSTSGPGGTARLSTAPLSSIWIGGRHTVEVPCTVEIEQTSDMLFTNVALDGVDAECGDLVLVHEAPSHVAFGERSVTRSYATIFRASSLERFWTRLTAYLELTELYEVGFQPKE